MSDFDYHDYEVTLSRQYADNGTGYTWRFEIIGPHGVMTFNRWWSHKADAELDAMNIIQADIDSHSQPETLTGQELYERVEERRKK